MQSTTYQQQLRELVEALGRANRESDVAPALAPMSPPSRVKMFVDGNLEKRHDKLEKQLEFIAPAFENLEDLIVEYIKSQPLAAFACAVTDAERMLSWLASRCELTAVQRDYISCQRARHAVEQRARRDRLAYVRFQEMSSLIEELLPQLGSDERLRIYLNPTRVWTTLTTSELVDESDDPPVQVLFFGNRGAVASAVIELEGQALLNELADYQPCTIGQWAELSSWAPRDELADFVRDLAAIGLVALG